MAITMTYRSAADWQRTTATATAKDPAVQKRVLTKAVTVAGKAKANLVVLASQDSVQGALAASTAERVSVKRVKIFGRRSRVPKSRIPVALVASDSKHSDWFEWGHGPDFRPTRYMTKAVRSASASDVVFTRRGRG